MKKLLLGMALGAAAGMFISDLPTVRELMSQGKKKVKNLTK